jgi:hypothetical protein
MKENTMILKILEKDYSIYKFDTEYIINVNNLAEEFISITKTEDELSVVAQQNKFNDFIAIENDWKIIKIEGILDFNLIGILSKISNILAGEKISIFVLSTYNTDYIMVKRDDLNKTIETLIKNEYEVKKDNPKMNC